MINQHINGSGYFALPSLAAVIYTLLLTLMLNAIVVLTYKLTFQEERFPNKLFQEVTISSVAAALVMMAVGENTGLGLIVLGSVLIAHLKAHIQNPRNSLLIFYSYSIGITTGQLNYTIAISSTILFCYLVILLYYPYKESN